MAMKYQGIIYTAFSLTKKSLCFLYSHAHEHQYLTGASQTYTISEESHGHTEGHGVRLFDFVYSSWIPPAIYTFMMDLVA